MKRVVQDRAKPEILTVTKNPWHASQKQGPWRRFPRRRPDEFVLPVHRTRLTTANW